MPVLTLFWLALLGGAAAVFFLQCLLVLKMKVDAAYLFAFCIYFDLFGYFYKLLAPGQALVLLIALPLLPVLAALFHRPTSARDIFRDPGVWLWAIFFVYALVSLAWTPSDSAGLTKEIVLFAHGVIPAAYIYVVYKKYGKFSWTAVAWVGLAFAAAHLLLGEYSGEYPGRLTLPGGNPIFHARASLMTATVCLWAKPIPLPLRLTALAAALVSAFATQSRGPVVVFAAANAVMFAVWLIRKYRNKRFGLSRLLVPLLLLFPLAGAALSAYGPQLAQWIGGSRFMVLFDVNQLFGDDNYIGRLELQAKALEKFAASPFFGAGLGSVTQPLARDFPHNIVLEIAAEGGIVGLTLWTFAVLFALGAAVGRSPLLAVLLLQTAGYALVSGDFGFNYEYVVIAFTALALMPQRQPKGAVITL
ncbi:O-antigen ligase family protein [Paenibacillus sp. FSL R5-0527]|uniref:O-antigen ligase family protein n=1 Tax=Paenibacillus sp. FSL R5-0527 TaxID=2975321 RepID=UPI00097A4456|nr:hypothetical protein BK140_17550 [Paenibacillus macerans]